MELVQQVPPQAVDADGNQLETTALYVADLELNVTDSQLYDVFNRLGPVFSVRLCKDKEDKSLGYGYVNYVNPQDAARALEMLNFTPLNGIGKPIRIMYSHRDPSVRKSGAGNIFIKNLDEAIDHKALHDTFSLYGNILSCKVATDSSGQSKGYGFVQYDSDGAAQEAIEEVNGMLLIDKQVFVGPFLTKKEREEAKLTIVFLEIRSKSDELKSFGSMQYNSDEAAQKAADKFNVMPLNGKQVYVRAFLGKQEREMAMDRAKFNNVFVKNLSESTTEEALENIFGEFGTITSAVVMRDADGTSRCFGFVNFESADDAARSVETLNGQTFDNKEWYVGKASKKLERELELKVRFEQSVKEAADKSSGLNLYIENLDDSIDDDSLKEMFSPFGTITSYKVIRDPHGISKGSGFVAFSTPEEASRALSEMNGKMVVSKPLCVAHAQGKEDQRVRLQAQFSQLRPVAMAPSVAPRMPMYPPGGPGLGQQIFYGQAPPAIMPTQAQFSQLRPVAMAPSVTPRMPMYPPCGPGLGQQIFYGQAPPAIMPPQAQFSQLRPVAMAPSVAPRMPMYPPGGPGLGQQIFYGQAPPAIMPPQPGFGYQQQLLLGTRTGWAPMPNFFMPMVQQGQRPGGTRGGPVPVQQGQQPLQFMQQQMLPRGTVYLYPPGRGLPDVSMQGVGGGMLSIPCDIGAGMPLRDAGMSQPIPIGALASALANASPSDQRTMLGENLYPLVDRDGNSIRPAPNPPYPALIG